MKILFIAINSLLIILFAFGQYLKFSPKVKARYGVILGVVFAAYLFLIAVISLHAAWARNFVALPLLIFLFIPFLIGKKASYETLSLWSNAQLAAFVGSLITCGLIMLL